MFDLNYFDSPDTFSNICLYYSSSEFLDFLSGINHDLFIMSFNIRSFRANIDKFMLLFERGRCPDVLILCETWFEEQSCLDLHNYVAYHTVRPGGRGGGASIYINNNLNSTTINTLNYCNQTIEICSVKLNLGNTCTNIVGIYRPHSNTVENFTNEITQILSNNSLNSNNTIIAGDFNINLLSDLTPTHSFINTMRSFHYLP